MERQTNAAGRLSARLGSHFADPASLALGLLELQALKGQQRSGSVTALRPVADPVVDATPASGTVTVGSSPQNITASKSEMQQSERANAKQNETVSANPLNLPLNPACLELYLKDADFENVFGMPKSKFYEMKRWKQRELKRHVNLF